MCSYIISSMNLVNSGEEQTKTIKYLNKRGSQPDEHSESATEKQFEQELLLARKIFRPSKPNQKPTSEALPPNCKIVVIETLQNLGHQRILPSHVPANKTKHKKGKSMDLQELFTSSRQQKKVQPKPEATKEKSKHHNSRQFNTDFKDRKSISQMKNYQYGSKKLAAHKNQIEMQHNFKKKKSKTIKSGEIKSLKKQIKKYIEETPIFIQRKEKSGKQTQRNHKNTSNMPRNMKSYSKSEEIFCEKPRKRHSHKEKSEQEFRDIAYSMPMTSKIIHLLSNTSSVYNSQKELDTVNYNRSYVIPTEESVAEIDQIRSFQHTILRKSSSDRFKHTRKATPINSLLQEQAEQFKDSTENIIRNIIFKLQESQNAIHINHLSKDIEQISFIPYENSIKERNGELPAELMGRSSNLTELQDISQCHSVKLDSEEAIQHEEVKQKEQEIKKLNNIIQQLCKTNRKIQKNEKESLLKRIKGLIGNSQQSPVASPKKEPIGTSSPSQVLSPKKEPRIEQKSNNEHDQSNLELNNSELRESFGIETDMSQLNLEMLDQALRQREFYLMQRKERQLEKLDQNYEELDLSQQKQKIIKWIDHEIKQVVHTRHQLWKGFNIAKDLLEGKEEQSAKKKKAQMMKSLSQKYFHRDSNRNKKKEKKAQSKEIQKEELRQKAEESSESKSEEELGEGRITDTEQIALQQSPQSVVQVTFHIESDQEQLLSAVKPNHPIMPQNQFHEEQPQKDEQSDSDYEYDRNNILNQPIEFTSSTDNTQVNVPESPGLNIKQIQCDIEYQNSFNQEDLQDLAKEGEKIRESMKLPFNLSIQDKQDIYQFIFLDLCVELTDEYSLQSPIIKKIFSFIKNLRQQSKKQKGFKTNTNIIKQYLFEFISFLKSKTDLLSEVYENLNKPLGPTALDILKYMHAYDEDPIDDDSSQTVFILDIKLFQQFENQYLGKITFETYYDDEEKQKKRRAFLKNAIHIHNKAIFDALNETLDKERPFGVWGEPFSWKKIAKFYHDRDTQSKNSTLLKSAQKTIEYGAYMCGFMIDKQECTLKSNPNISPAYIQQIRDDRLSRMLANDLQQSEQKMLFIDDEQTEILVEVGHLIYQSLLQEMYKDLVKILL